MSVDPLIELDVLPAFCRAKIVILGVGNVLFGDDGFGPAVAEYLVSHYQIPDDMYVMDVGTGVRKLLFTLLLSETRPEEIVIVDAVDWGQTAGRVATIPVEALPTNKLDDFSLHQVPTSNMLRELQDQCGVKVTVIVCDVGPIVQEMRSGLSALSRQAVDKVGQQLARRFNMMSSLHYSE